MLFQQGLNFHPRVARNIQSRISKFRQIYNQQTKSVKYCEYKQQNEKLRIMKYQNEVDSLITHNKSIYFKSYCSISFSCNIIFIQDNWMGVSQGKGQSQPTAHESLSTFKLALVGDSKTGKTCIANRLIHNRFNLKTDPTIGIDHFKAYNPTKSVEMRIWDPTGNQEFRGNLLKSVKQVDCVIFVFDLSDAQAYQKCSGWLEAFKTINKENTIIAVCGNKSDLPRKTDVSLIKKHFDKETPYYQVSAANGSNIKEMFAQLCDIWEGSNKWMHNNRLSVQIKRLEKEKVNTEEKLKSLEKQLSKTTQKYDDILKQMSNKIKKGPRYDQFQSKIQLRSQIQHKSQIEIKEKQLAKPGPLKVETVHNQKTMVGSLQKIINDIPSLFQLYESNTLKIRQNLLSLEERCEALQSICQGLEWINTNNAIQTISKIQWAYRNYREGYDSQYVYLPVVNKEDIASVTTVSNILSGINLSSSHILE